MFKIEKIFTLSVFLIFVLCSSSANAAKEIFPLPLRLDGVVYETGVFLEFEFVTLNIPISEKGKSDDGAIIEFLEFISGIKNEKYDKAINFILKDESLNEFGGTDVYLKMFNRSLSKIENMDLIGYFSIGNKRKYLVKGTDLSGKEKIRLFSYEKANGRYMYSENKSQTKLDFLLNGIIRNIDYGKNKYTPISKKKLSSLISDGYQKYSLHADDIFKTDGVNIYLKLTSLLGKNANSKSHNVKKVSNLLRESLASKKLDDYLSLLGGKSRKKLESAFSKMSREELDAYISINTKLKFDVAIIDANPLYIMLYTNSDGNLKKSHLTPQLYLKKKNGTYKLVNLYSHGVFIELLQDKNFQKFVLKKNI